MIQRSIHKDSQFYSFLIELAILNELFDLNDSINNLLQQACCHLLAVLVSCLLIPETFNKISFNYHYQQFYLIVVLNKYMFKIQLFLIIA